MACREYTLPREEDSSEQKGWISRDTQIGPVLEVATCCLHGKCGVEIRIWSLNRDNTHSRVRISQGSNKFATNLNNNDQEISEVQLEEYALKLDARDFASRSKAKAKPQRRDSAGSSPRIVPIGKRTWTDIEPQKYSLSDYPVSKKLIIFFVMEAYLETNDGAIEFWRIKDYLRDHFVFCHHWSDKKWKSSLARGGGNKKRFQYCTDSSRTTHSVPPSSPRSFRTQSY